MISQTVEVPEMKQLDEERVIKSCMKHTELHSLGLTSLKNKDKLMLIFHLLVLREVK